MGEIYIFITIWALLSIMDKPSMRTALPYSLAALYKRKLYTWERAKARRKTRSVYEERCYCKAVCAYDRGHSQWSCYGFWLFLSPSRQFELVEQEVLSLYALSRVFGILGIGQS